jgi:hypothetical protein
MSHFVKGGQQGILDRTFLRTGCFRIAKSCLSPSSLIVSVRRLSYRPVFGLEPTRQGADTFCGTARSYLSAHRYVSGLSFHTIDPGTDFGKVVEGKTAFMRYVSVGKKRNVGDRVFSNEEVVL